MRRGGSRGRAPDYRQVRRTARPAGSPRAATRTCGRWTTDSLPGSQSPTFPEGGRLDHRRACRRTADSRPGRGDQAVEEPRTAGRRFRLPVGSGSTKVRAAADAVRAAKRRPRRRRCSTDREPARCSGSSESSSACASCCNRCSFRSISPVRITLTGTQMRSPGWSRTITTTTRTITRTRTPIRIPIRTLPLASSLRVTPTTTRIRRTRQKTTWASSWINCPDHRRRSTSMRSRRCRSATWAPGTSSSSFAPWRRRGASEVDHHLALQPSPGLLPRSSELEAQPGCADRTRSVVTG